MTCVKEGVTLFTSKISQLKISVTHSAGYSTLPMYAWTFKLEPSSFIYTSEFKPFALNYRGYEEMLSGL